LRTTPVGAGFGDPALAAMSGDGLPAGDQMSGARAHALEFQRRLDESLANRAEPVDGGAAIFCDRLPRVADLNFLRIDSASDRIDGRALMAEADRLQAGLAHRAVRVLDAEAAPRLARDFAAAGWVLRRTAIMVQRRMFDRPVDTGAVRELTIDDVRGARLAAVRHEHRDADVGSQVLAAGELAADGVAPRVFGASVGGEVTAFCTLRLSGDVAKIAEAEALSRSSGRGVGKAVIAESVLAARRAGARLVFVEPADEDWAKWTYHRMGFDEAGKVHFFVRPWG